MTDESKPPVFEPFLRRRVLLARWAGMWEGLWPALWPAMAVAGTFVVGALLGIWQALPGWLHALVLVAFAVAFGFALRRAGPAFSLPSEADGMHRLERTSGVPHRPLTTLIDRPAGDDPGALALWRLHQRRMREAARKVRVTLPRAGLARRDPFGLRAVLILLLVIGVAGAGSDGFGQIARALEPRFGTDAGASRGDLLAWIDPPEYTGLPPVYLSHGGEQPVPAPEAPDIETRVSVPAGSTLVARVHGGSREPVLVLDGQETLFSTAAEDDYETSLTLNGGDSLAVRQGGMVLSDWKLDVIPDQPPEVALVDRPEQTRRNVLRIDYEASDDYGLESVRAELKLVEGTDETLTLDLPLSGRNPREVSQTNYQDLTPHPWAGLPVDMVVVARDQIGQETATPVAQFVLPEKEFTHPVAKAIIEQRKRLTSDPKSRPDVHKALASIAGQPDAYGNDLTAFLVLSIALDRLFNDRRSIAETGVLDLLWDVALRIEDGQLSIAERDLRKAQDDLREALDSDASQEEIAALTQQLREAMDRYLDLLNQQQDQQPSQAQGSQPQEDMRTREDLQNMLDQAQEMAQTGARDQARQMLDQLQEMLENMEPMSQTANDAENGDQPEMDRLKELSERQEQMLDQTYRDAMSRGAYERSEPGRGETGSTAQESLRRALGDLMRDIGENGMQIPDALGKAERAMRQAAKELERSNSRRAVEAQSMALDQLRQGAQQLRQAMGQNTQGAPGQGGQSGDGQVGRDPLGRMPPGNKAEDDGSIKIPAASDLQRSREILNELYRRAGDRDRPTVEREYIDRLLDWY